MCYCLFFSIKLHEAVDLLNSLIDEDENAQEEVAAVYIQPPDPAYDSADSRISEEIGPQWNGYYSGESCTSK